MNHLEDSNIWGCKKPDFVPVDNLLAYKDDTKPVHKHDCNNCTFVMSLTNGARKSIDVYRNCNTTDPNGEFIIRYSSEPGDYATTGLRMLAWFYARTHHPDWR
jgi:hypothetical protein